MRKSDVGILIVLAIAWGAVWQMWPTTAVVQAQAGIPGNPVNCVVTVSTATTVQAFGAPCLAGGRDIQQALYITDILVSTNATAIAADSFLTIKYGTGTTCGTGTTIVWGAITGNGTFTTASAALTQSFKTPIRIPPNTDLCWIGSTAGSKFIVVNGYTAP